MKNINVFKFGALLLATVSFASCEDFLTTQPSDMVSDQTALANTAQIQKDLISAYNQLLFNSSGGSDRVFGGVHGLQLLFDERGEDIMSHSNMGGSQCSSYNFSPSFTRADGDANLMWTFCYKLINQCNQIIDALPNADGEANEKQFIEGQAKAMRGIAYFYLIQTYQQTYTIAQNKRGVILRLFASDPAEMTFATVDQVYTQIVSDLTAASTSLKSFQREQMWQINADVATGWLARVYQVMGKWSDAASCAQSVYDKYSTLMTKEQWYNGFDECVSAAIPEVVWASWYTIENNHGGDTIFNYFYNQDPDTYGEGQSGIYRFFNFFVTPAYVALFDETDWRGAKVPYDQAVVTDDDEKAVMFWRRSNNANEDIGTKWAYNKFKHYGDASANTLPEFCLMRGTEMLLILAEAKANTGDTAGAIALLNKLQASRNAALTTTTDKTELLEAIYKERRKELLGEGVTGQYDLVRLQKPLVRIAANASDKAQHYSWGVENFDGYNAGDAVPTGTLPSNDYRWFFQIPQDEFSYNSAITQADQNPFKGQ